jgi:hypothetical protein
MDTIAFGRHRFSSDSEERTSMKWPRYSMSISLMSPPFAAILHRERRFHQRPSPVAQQRGHETGQPRP